MLEYEMERRILAILLIVFLLTVGLYGLRGSTVDHALAEPPSRPLFDAPWSTNVRVNDDAGAARQLLPSIAVDSSGNAYGVWTDGRNMPDDIYFSYRPAGGNWEANVRVNDNDATAYQDYPSIGVDPGGNAYAVWRDDRNGSGNDDIYFSYRPAGGGWGANFKVNDDTGTAHQTSPGIAVDASGNAYAVWMDDRNGSGNEDIYFAYRPAGGSWGTNVRVNDDVDLAAQSDPSIAVDAGGNAYAVWADFRNGDNDIYFACRTAGGSWGANVKVNDDTGTTHQGSPAIAVDASGNAYAVWADGRNGNSDIYFSYRPAGGSWEANVKVNDDPGTASECIPAIAVDASGNAYAVWTHGGNGDVDIYSSYCPAGGTWGPNVKVNDHTATVAEYSLDIDADGVGNAYAVWEDYRNDPDGLCDAITCDDDIYFSYRPAGAPTPTPSPLAGFDFAVEDVWWSPTAPEAMSVSTIYVRMVNVGSTYEPTTGRYTIAVKLTDTDGAPDDYWYYRLASPDTIPALLPYEAFEFHIPFYFTRPEADLIEVTLFPADIDSNVANNARTEGIIILPAAHTMLNCMSMLVDAVMVYCAAEEVAVEVLVEISTEFLVTAAKAVEAADAGHWDKALQEFITFLGKSVLSIAADLAKAPVKVAISVVKAAVSSLWDWFQCLDATGDILIRLMDDLQHRGVDINATYAESPIYVVVTNSSNERAGFLDDGSVVNEIADAEVLQATDGRKLILYPGRDTQSVLVTGSAVGDFDLLLAIAKPDGSTHHVDYQNVSVWIDTVGTIDATNPAYPLELDDNGDGTIDRVVSPSSITVVWPHTIYLPLIMKND